MVRRSKAWISWMLGGALTLAIGGWQASPARTQDAAEAALAERVSGQWQLAIEQSEARSRIERGIARATANMPPLVDAIAARTLRERTPLSRTLEIDATAARLAVRFDHSFYDTRPGHPRTVPVPEDPSTSMEVVQHFRDGRLEQIFTTSQGRRWNTFTLSEDGRTLTLEAVIQSSRLPAPVRFTIPYRR